MRSNYIAGVNFNIDCQTYWQTFHYSHIPNQVGSKTPMVINFRSTPGMRHRVYRPILLCIAAYSLRLNFYLLFQIFCIITAHPFYSWVFLCYYFQVLCYLTLPFYLHHNWYLTLSKNNVSSLISLKTHDIIGALLNRLIEWVFEKLLIN
jgi:hypothetical protein